jgi:hypothetical protein
MPSASSIVLYFCMLHSLNYISARDFVQCFRSGSRRPEYILSCILQIPFFRSRNVNQLLEQGQGGPETAGLGAGAGGVHAGQQLEETAE